MSITYKVPQTSGIYQIINLVNQKRYIGYASNIKARANGHIYDLQRNKHGNDYLQKAWDKYGKYNFIFEVLQLCKKEELCLMEDYWVRILKVRDPEFGYNLKDTDPDGKSGLSEETIAKIKATKKARVYKPADMKGSKNPMYGKTRSEETRRKAGINITKNRKHWKRWKPVFDWDKLVIYKSLREASDISGIPKAKLSKYLLGTRTNKTSLMYV